MIVPGSANPLMMAGGGYQISRSVRLRSSASAYFNRTLSASSRTTWSWSGWVKRGTLGGAASQDLFEGGTDSSNWDYMRFTTSDTLQIVSAVAGTVNLQLVTTQVFRDPSAWYHIVLVYDTTQATAANRVKLYVNGVQITAFSTATYPAQNYNGWIGSANAHRMGANVVASPGEFFDGYLTEINFIDGQALTPSSFGQNDPITGVWQPKKYASTYGTNGFYLNFSDNSAATAAAIGADKSGNGNNWTPNNISVTAGATYDSMLDVPTLYADGGNGRGNYAVMNPLFAPNGYGATTFSNANLSVQKSTAGFGAAASTIAFPTSGKYYFEATIVSSVGSGNQQMGISDTSTLYNFILDCFYSGSLIRKGVDGVVTTGYGSAANGTVIGVAVDATNGKAYLAINNTWIDSSSPTGGTGGYSMTAGIQYFAWFAGSGSGASAYNFGQQPFTYTPPTGFQALNTQNLPDATIKAGNKYFDATAYTGNGSTQNIVNSGGFQPDFVWMKNRTAVNSHVLVDAVRGATNRLNSDSTSAESTSATSLTSFNSNGFSIGSDANVNGNTNALIGWQWKRGATPGFDVVTYTGTGSARTISHACGSAPQMIIVKVRNAGTANWLVYHSGSGAGNYLQLNGTAGNTADTTAWNNTAPTSSVFSLGTAGAVNNNTNLYVAYLFAEVAGFSKFGKYTGNGSTDGPFVFTGLRARFIMVKRTDSAGNWYIYDTARETYNVLTQSIYPNLSNAEANDGATLDILSNGFKWRRAGVDQNASGGTYIFMAFAESPFKNSLAR